jgi:hypothetical protein
MLRLLQLDLAPANTTSSSMATVRGYAVHGITPNRCHPPNQSGLRANLCLPRISCYSALVGFRDAQRGTWPWDCFVRLSRICAHRCWRRCGAFASRCPRNGRGLAWPSALVHRGRISIMYSGGHQPSSSTKYARLRNWRETALLYSICYTNNFFWTNRHGIISNLWRHQLSVF